MKILAIRLLTLMLVFGTLWTASAQVRSRAVPYPTAETPEAIDVGPLKAVASNTPISVTVALHLRNLDEAERLLKAVSAPGNAQYHQFLTSQQFVARFAPTDADVAKVVASLGKYGLSVERTTATTLRVTGTPAALERAFAVSLHSYEVPAHGSSGSYTYHAPLGRATIPSEIAGSTAGVVGLDNRPALRPHIQRAAKTLRRAATKPSAKSAEGNAPGFWTVKDFANYYDVQPLYTAGYRGSNRTIGIITFASFTPSDALTYWHALGLSAESNRISVVNVDGGPGAPSDDSGSDETTLDVEQSGGIAPAAKVIVYQGPNTNQAFVDAFATAIDTNVAATLSTSWGDWEWVQNLENAPVIDPTTGKTVGVTDATHELLVRAGIQGQSVFAAAGDGGAYDTDNDFNYCYPDTCGDPLTVDYPASDPAITAAGGTTLPGLQQYCLNDACTPPYYNVTVVHERVWGWDYLDGLCKYLGYDPISCGIFPAGGGGGVSILFQQPDYQFISGTQRSQPGQKWTLNGKLVYTLPSHFAGRNVPDLSYNADPDTGYVLYYTSSSSGFGVFTFGGGTSFVAPQLNGVAAVLGQYIHGRLGFVNPLVYGLALTNQAYTGANPPLHAIKNGDNWFYHGRNGYSPAAGLGTLDVANFANVLRPLP